MLREATAEATGRHNGHETFDPYRGGAAVVSAKTLPFAPEIAEEVVRIRSNGNVRNAFFTKTGELVAQVATDLNENPIEDPHPSPYEREVEEAIFGLLHGRLDIDEDGNITRKKRSLRPQRMQSLNQEQTERYVGLIEQRLEAVHEIRCQAAQILTAHPWVTNLGIADHLEAAIVHAPQDWQEASSSYGIVGLSHTEAQNCWETTVTIANAQSETPWVIRIDPSKGCPEEAVTFLHESKGKFLRRPQSPIPVDQIDATNVVLSTVNPEIGALTQGVHYVQNPAEVVWKVNPYLGAEEVARKLRVPFPTTEEVRKVGVARDGTPQVAGVSDADDTFLQWITGGNITSPECQVLAKPQVDDLYRTARMEKEEYFVADIVREALEKSGWGIPDTEREAMVVALTERAMTNRPSPGSSTGVEVTSVNTNTSIEEYATSKSSMEIGLSLTPSVVTLPGRLLYRYRLEGNEMKCTLLQVTQQGRTVTETPVDPNSALLLEYNVYEALQSPNLASSECIVGFTQPSTAPGEQRSIIGVVENEQLTNALITQKGTDYTIELPSGAARQLDLRNREDFLLKRVFDVLNGNAVYDAQTNTLTDIPQATQRAQLRHITESDWLSVRDAAEKEWIRSHIAQEAPALIADLMHALPVEFTVSSDLIDRLCLTCPDITPDYAEDMQKKNRSVGIHKTYVADDGTVVITFFHRHQLADKGELEFFTLHKDAQNVIHFIPEAGEEEVIEDSFHALVCAAALSTPAALLQETVYQQLYPHWKEAMLAKNRPGIYPKSVDVDTRGRLSVTEVTWLADKKSPPIQFRYENGSWWQVATVKRTEQLAPIQSGVILAHLDNVRLSGEPTLVGIDEINKDIATETKLTQEVSKLRPSDFLQVLDDDEHLLLLMTALAVNEEIDSPKVLKNPKNFRDIVANDAFLTKTTYAAGLPVLPGTYEHDVTHIVVEDPNYLATVEVGLHPDSHRQVKEAVTAVRPNRGQLLHIHSDAQGKYLFYGGELDREFRSGVRGKGREVHFLTDAQNHVDVGKGRPTLLQGAIPLMERRVAEEVAMVRDAVDKRCRHMANGRQATFATVADGDVVSTIALNYLLRNQHLPITIPESVRDIAREVNSYYLQPYYRAIGR